MEREKCFEREYGGILKRLDVDRKGKPVPIYKQVYMLNKLIYAELDICRDQGINPKWSRCHNILIDEGEKRFTKHGYLYAGRIFVRKDKI